MHVVITGGAGFIGQHVARALVSAGYTITAVDTLAAQVHADPDASRRRFPGEVLARDVSDESTWAQLGNCDAVVHLAAETGVGQSMYESDRYRRVNVEGTRLAARFAAGRGVPLVMTSSRAVYGEGRYECAPHGVHFDGPCCNSAVPSASLENDDLQPVSVYGQTKVDAESVATNEAAESGLTIWRPQNVVGPGQALHNPYTGVLAAFLAMLRESRPLTVYGDGSDTRDFIHVDDMAALIAWSVRHSAPAGSPRILNAGTGRRTSLTELAQIAIESAPIASPGVTNLDVHRSGDISHALADLTRLKASGAPLPKRTSADAIGDFIRASWDEPGAPSEAWEAALQDLQERGLSQ